MIGSLITISFILFASSLCGVYNNSHDTIRNNCFGSSNIDHVILGDIGSTQNAITPSTSIDYSISSVLYDQGYYLGVTGAEFPILFRSDDAIDSLNPYISNLSIGDIYTSISSTGGYLDYVIDTDYSTFADGYCFNPFLYQSLSLTFDNIGNDLHIIYLDFSDSGFLSVVLSFLYTFDSGSFNQNITFSASSLVPVPVYSNSSVLVTHLSALTSSLTAIYYDDLNVAGPTFEDGYIDSGVDAYSGYENGYSDGLDDANQPWTLVDGFTDVLGIVLNAFFIFLSLDVFGIELSYIFAILLGVVMIVWILKLVRG